MAATLPALGAVAVTLHPLLPLAPLSLPLLEADPAIVAFVNIIVLPRLECATSLLLLLGRFFLQRNQIQKLVSTVMQI
jgi:hypothetical protein